MTKPGKIYKNPDAWVARVGCAVSILAALVVGGFLSLIVWGLVELNQLLGRLG